MPKKTALFAAGCFWGVESKFRATNGVIDTRAGYTGGSVPTPTYQQICDGNTGHAEAVKVEYDSDQISYDELLNVFWGLHDPTTRNRQGPDIGSQYRSAIFALTNEQAVAAKASAAAQNETGRFGAPIVTEIEPAKEFFDAEEYHQRYFEKHGYR